MAKANASSLDAGSVLIASLQLTSPGSVSRQAAIAIFWSFVVAAMTIVKTVGEQEAYHKHRFRYEINPNHALTRLYAAANLADTEGFEPSKDREALASLAGRWFQPLTHVST